MRRLLRVPYLLAALAWQTSLAADLDAPPPGAFTVVVIPDTQGYLGARTKATPDSTDPLTNPVFANHIQWIRTNVTNQNIVFVSHVGDIVDIDNEEQWTLACQNLDGLRGLVPFGLTVGNHDMKASGNASLFQRFFPAERFKAFPWYGGSFEPTGAEEAPYGNNVNSFQLFSAGGTEFVFLHLECNAPDPVLAWAGELLTRHSGRVALISTHMDLGVRERPVKKEDHVSGERGRMEWNKCLGERGNTPLQMWDKLYRKHANLALVFSGDQSRVTALHLAQKGDHGNTVHALMSDYESAGPLRLYRFLPGPRSVQVITYDTTKHELVEHTTYAPERSEHQFTLRDVLPPATSEAGATPRPGYLGLVKAYADAMIRDGRDTTGSERSPLFASALDRKTMRLGTFGDIPGIRNGDRSLGGANPQTDAPLYAILYELTALTGEKKYAEASDQALAFFFTRCQSPQTGLMAWGEHLYWDFNKEAVNDPDGKHEICGEWPFWDACNRLAPDACWTFAIGLWDHQVADKKTGDFSRHAKWSSHGPGRGADFPRYAGQMITCWADAYARPCNASRGNRSSLTTAVSVVVARMASNMTKAPTGYLLAGTDPVHRQISWPGSNLELARCLWASAPHMDGELARSMKALALRQDEQFLSLPHTLLSGGGFVACVDASNGVPRARSMNKPYTETWSSGYGHGVHAEMANLCHARLRQLEKERPDLAAKYRELALEAANVYVTARPDAKELLMPGSFASVIQLLLRAHELTGDKKYADSADAFGRLGIALFLNDGLPLPQATNRHGHYETITGGPDFMRALLCLYTEKPE